MGAKGKQVLKEEIEEKRKEREGKDKKTKKKEEPKVQKKKIMEGIQGIIRIAGTDLDGTKKLSNSLLKIKGIGKTLALTIPRAAGFDTNILTGKLTEEQVKKLENAILNPCEFGIPIYNLNRRKDRETGENKHLVSSELAFAKKFDIDNMKKLHTYKGIRHEAGLPVRGQRTRSSFRTGIRVGVSKKAVKKPAGAASEAAGEKKAQKTFAPKVLAKPGEKKEEKKE